MVSKLEMMEFLKALAAGPGPLILAAIVGCAIRDWVDTRKRRKRNG